MCCACWVGVYFELLLKEKKKKKKEKRESSVPKFLIVQY